MKIERHGAVFNFFQTERVGDVTIKMSMVDGFSGLRKNLKWMTKNAIEQTSHHLPLHELTISIKNDSKKVIPGHAHAGWTYSAKDVQITVNPSFSDKEYLLHVEFPRSVSHELHHAVRDKVLPNEKRSLEAELMAEGLATVFETEVWGGIPSDWAKPLSKEQMQSLLEKVIIESEDLHYDHGRWFFGTSDLPRWAGYSIGVFLIKEYIRLHPEETAATLVATPASVILDELKQTILKRPYPLLPHQDVGSIG